MYFKIVRAKLRHIITGKNWCEYFEIESDFGNEVHINSRLWWSCTFSTMAIHFANLRHEGHEWKIAAPPVVNANKGRIHNHSQNRLNAYAFHCHNAFSIWAIQPLGHELVRVLLTHTILTHLNWHQRTAYSSIITLFVHSVEFTVFKCMQEFHIK